MVLINLLQHNQVARRFRLFIRNSCPKTPSQRRQLERVFVRSRGACVYCGSVNHRRLHVDHVVPLVRGGPDVIENKAIACDDCNRTKNYRTAAEIGRPDLQVFKPASSLAMFRADRRERVRARRNRRRRR